MSRPTESHIDDRTSKKSEVRTGLNWWKHILLYNECRSRIGWTSIR